MTNKPPHLLSDVEFSQQAADSLRYLSIEKLKILQLQTGLEIGRRMSKSADMSCDVCGSAKYNLPSGTFGCLKDHRTLTNTYCAECNKPQFNTPSGITCVNGHGGADSLDAPAAEFKMTADQEKAWAALQKWHKGDHPYFVLRGFAGTGKSFLMKKLLDLPGNWHFSAPTNKASSVLADFLKQPTKTTYSLLGLRMVAEEDVLHLERAKNPPDLGSSPLIVIDEAGMIPKVLADMLQELVNDKGYRIIFVGDPAQLNPVGESISPVWKLAHPEHNVIMREVKRFDNQLLKLSVAIRTCLREKRYDFEFENDNSGDEGVFVVAQSEMRRQIKSLALADWQNTKVISWRNKTVDSYNKLIRSALGFTDPYHVGERLLIGEPIISGDKVIAHTDEEVEVLSIDKRVFNFPEGPLEAHCLSLNEKSFKLYIPVNEGALQSHLAKRAAHANSVTGLARNKAWASFWELKQSFQSVRYGYCLTAHRAQGSTMKSVFVDVSDILANRNKREAYRCLYVAATRPTKSLITF